MTIEEMTVLSCVFLVIAVVLGITSVVLFFVWKIPKRYRTIKRQKRHQKKVHRMERISKPKTTQSETVRLDKKQQEKVPFTVLQDITYVHIE